VESLRHFERLIQRETDHETSRRLTVAAALKDTQSPLHHLGADILRLIGQQMWLPEILRWEDVMQEYIVADNTPKIL